MYILWIILEVSLVVMLGAVIYFAGMSSHWAHQRIDVLRERIRLIERQLFDEDVETTINRRLDRLDEEAYPVRHFTSNGVIKRPGKSPRGSSL